MTLHLVAVPLLALLPITGCAVAKDTDPEHHLTRQAAGPGSDLAAGYSLLYDVVSDEARVDGLFIMRNPGSETKQLVADIAARAKQAQADLEAIASADPRVRLDAAGLPDAEVAVRDLIADWQQKKLMFGGDFERNLLLTQAEATQYMAALAQRISETDDDPQRIERLKALAQDMQALHERVAARLVPAE